MSVFLEVTGERFRPVAIPAVEGCSAWGGEGLEVLL